MGWVLLISAICIEGVATTFLKLSFGFSKLGYGAAALGCYALSFTAFSLTLKKLPMSLSYPVLAGGVAILVMAVGILGFKETVSPIKLVSVFLIVTGVIGLRVG